MVLALADAEVKQVSSFVSVTELGGWVFVLFDAKVKLSFVSFTELAGSALALASLTDLENLEFKLIEGCTLTLLAVKTEGAKDIEEDNSALMVGPVISAFGRLPSNSG
eukprot:1518350-Prymnesium_polylepis.1